MTDLEYLKQPIILSAGRLSGPDYLVDLGELHRIPRGDRSFVIGYNTRLFFSFLNHREKAIMSIMLHEAAAFLVDLAEDDRFFIDFAAKDRLFGA